MQARAQSPPLVVSRAGPTGSANPPCIKTSSLARGTATQDKRLKQQGAAAQHSSWAPKTIQGPTSTKPFDPSIAQHCPRRSPFASSPKAGEMPSGCTHSFDLTSETPRLTPRFLTGCNMPAPLASRVLGTVKCTCCGDGSHLENGVHVELHWSGQAVLGATRHS